MKYKKLKVNILDLVLTFCILLFVFSIPAPAEAAQIYLETRSSDLGVGQGFEVSVYVDSDRETVNAFAGTIHLPSIITPRNIRDGDSLVALWGNRPELSENKIVFAGIVPGGWNGSRGLLFSFTALASREGEGSIDFSNVEVLLHDGKGTPTSVSLRTMPLGVSKSVALVDFVEDIEDVEPPEVFVLSIGHSEELFSGDTFVVFTAQDKGSGIDHYEVLETRKKLKDESEGKWEHVKSPYRLSDQSLTSFIYVRAVDRAGNVRVSVFAPEEKKAVSLKFAIGIILLLLFFFVMFFIRRVRRLNI